MFLAHLDPGLILRWNVVGKKCVVTENSILTQLFSQSSIPPTGTVGQYELLITFMRVRI